MPSIRILGGDNKNAVIHFPHHEGLRPTMHRVRQSAFDMLIHRFYSQHIGQSHTCVGLRILDICAGLGGYGFEALSRGAAHVTFIEQIPTLAKHLSLVARSWNMADRVRVLNHSWPQAPMPGDRDAASYDVAFFDPPYGQENAAMVAMIEACGPWIKAGGFLMVESNGPLTEPAGLSLIFLRTIGKKHLSFFQKMHQDGAPEPQLSPMTPEITPESTQ
jgi:16S rRNA (guanine966-N2)-methyltransferase